MTNTKGRYRGEFGEVDPSDAVNHEPEKKFPPVPEKDRYEAKVREIAEEMAKATPQTGDPQTHLILRIYAERFVPAARIAVKHMAEMYRSSYSVGRDMDNDPYSRAGLSTMLKTLGLIPAPEQRKEAGEV